MIAGAFLFAVPGTSSPSNDPSAAAPPPATPVSVAVVEERDVALWDEFSGRLEAIERVDLRSRVAGEVQAVHFREGALVEQGRPADHHRSGTLRGRGRAGRGAGGGGAGAPVARHERARAGAAGCGNRASCRSATSTSGPTRSARPRRTCAPPKPGWRSRGSNLDYTAVRAPVSGRVGKLEVTVGNLVAAGPGAPVLTTLVSIDPIYASFNADEEAVARVLGSLGPNPHAAIERIPVQMVTATSNGTTYEGRLQLIDNQVDAPSGTVFVRAVFANPDGTLMPGQFARLRMGRAATEPALMVSERAVGTDQDKKFVTVVGADNKAVYREVTLGAAVDGLRVVTHGLAAGERVVVNGLQRVRPGALVAPQLVPMLAEAQATRRARRMTRAARASSGRTAPWISRASSSTDRSSPACCRC